ncbi:hypothetical protein V2J09_009844 [Rumex salicifolius]
MGFCSRSRFLILIFCVCIGICGVLASAQKNRPKNVQVALRAKWEGTPLLLEAGELISREGKDLFWDFIDNWLQKDTDDSSSCTARFCINKIVEHGRSLLSEHLSSIFEVSLLLRSASPRLVLYRQLAGESLSSYPDEGILSTAGGNTESNEETERVDSLLVGVNPKSPGGKCCWVDTGGSMFFDAPELLQWLGTPDKDSSQQPELFDFDHLYLESNASSPVAILYGSLATGCFKEFHNILVKAAKEGKVRYVVRPVLPSSCEESSSGCGVVGTRGSLNLGGYGVELALKNMEYKAMDDSMVKKSAHLKDAQDESSEMPEHITVLSSESTVVDDDLIASTISDTLDIWELKDLGHQTAQKIVHSSDPLLLMQEISQNFPSIVSSLSRMKLNNSVKEEILSNQRMIPPGKALMAINRALVNIEEIDLHSLIDLVSKELSLADQFSKIKIPETSIQKLLSTSPGSDSSAFRIDFRSSHVHYLNNLEEDPMYKRWRSNVNEILMPAFPGQMRYIRKNLFHAVYIVDPASSCGLEVIEMIVNFYENQLPIRFGVVLYSEAFTKNIENGAAELQTSSNDTEEDISILIVRLFLYIKEQHGVPTAFKFLSNIKELQNESGDPEEDAPERHLVEKAFVETLVPKSKSLPQDLLLKLEKEKTYKDEAQKSSIFVTEMGFSRRGCTLLMNGLVFDASEEALITAMNEELPKIQEQVYYGNIESHTDVLEKLFSENGISRYNPQIVTDGKIKPKFVSLSESRSDRDFLLNDLSYLHSPETSDDLKPVTHLLAVNVTSKKGIKLLREGIRYLQSTSERGRLGVLFGPSNLDSDSAGVIFVKVYRITALSYSYKNGVLSFLDQLCSLYERDFQQLSSFSADSKQTFLGKVLELVNTHNLPSEIYNSLLKVVSVLDVRNHLNKAALFLHRHLEADSNMNAVITNGRVVRITEDTGFLSHDLNLLESLEFKQRIKPILGIIEDVNWQDMDPDSLTSKFISDVVMLVSSSLASRERSTDSARFEVLHADYSAVILNHENSSIHIDAVIDPLSPSGQKLATLLRLLSKYIQPSMRIILNPLSSLSDLPLKNYYRYVIPSMDDFSSTDSTVNGPKAFFANMPLSKTLTMNLDVPEPWLVEPVVAVHDLDNILLENLGEITTLQAVFELEALVLTGYWQLKASPGIWYLQLAPGRSSELYVLKENDGTDGTALAKRIIINDLRGKVVHLEVVKKKNKEHEKLLISNDDDTHSETEEKSENIWNKNILKWASGLIGGKQNTRSKERSSQVVKSGRHGKTVNIFSIASGHLYERFTKIMILSVLKNTQRPVKFWFIKNYLSPQFKDVIPHMAKEYGFEYELITYKWPSWLHKQKEKQRIVWAYKILFLDVIFPLSLEKVIYVDADQVVRADMGELYDMDIKGRPLAYTPFCDNNREMDGYRFWSQGFWKEHLRGRPYHISALYVVDLVRFRQTASGDTLRDLPNYAQHIVPIFSLPQEWLWCESWCGNATKTKAKTIDLCNNPMTKEPKLQGARRIVTEWVDLDSEARGFTSKYLGEDSDLQASSPSSTPPQPSPSKDSSYETDLESKAEL